MYKSNNIESSLQKVNVQPLGRMEIAASSDKQMSTFILRRFGRIKINANLENLLTYH